MACARRAGTTSHCKGDPRVSRTRELALSSRPAGQAQFEAIEDAIATCDGDSRATIKALLIANSYLEAEMRIVHDAAPVMRGRMFKDVKVK